MKRQEKCEAIVQKIAELVAEGKDISFLEDWGKWTATVQVDNMHTHIGVPDGNFDTFVDSVYETLCENRGLSWVKGN